MLPSEGILPAIESATRSPVQRYARAITRGSRSILIGLSGRR
jgi:hypothetical protein